MATPIKHPEIRHDYVLTNRHAITCTDLGPGMLEDASQFLVEMFLETRFIAEAPVPVVGRVVVVGPIGVAEGEMTDEAVVLACHLIDDQGRLLDCGYLFADKPSRGLDPINKTIHVDASEIVKSLRKEYRANGN